MHSDGLADIGGKARREPVAVRTVVLVVAEAVVALLEKMPDVME